MKKGGKRQAVGRISIEMLEGRTLLSGAVIAGTIFDDPDADGYDRATIPRAGVTVFLDRNDNGLVDNGEETAISDGEGNYRFENVEPGLVKVRAAALEGWSQAQPITSLSAIPDSVQDSAIFTYRSKTITGTIFKDLNRNGVRDDGEGGFNNIVVTATHDKIYGDGSGMVVVPPEPYVTYPTGVSYFTNPDGTFTLRDVPIFSNQVVISVYDWYLTTPADDQSNDLVIGLAHPSDLTNDPLGTVHGIVFNDLNHNGTMDAGEPPIAGVKVQAGWDSWPNGAPSAITDSNGFYQLKLSRGHYRLIAPSPNDLLWDNNLVEFSIFEGETKTINPPASFYSRVSGKILVMGQSEDLSVTQDYQVVSYLDFNDNGKRDADEPRMIGAIGWDYQITTTTEGNYTVRLEKIPSGLELVSELPRGTTMMGYANEHEPIYLAYKTEATVYFDKNRNGRRDRREPLLQKLKIVVDQNDNGIAERSEKKYRTNSAGRFHTLMGYGTTRLKVTIPQRYRKLGLFSRDYKVTVLNRADAAGLLIGLVARKR